jgi:hypothetical protein
MEHEDAKALYYQMLNSFGAKDDEGKALAWSQYLPKQDFAMAKKTVDYFLYQSDKEFMPSVAVFHSRLRQIQSQHSIAEWSKIDASACTKCGGITWEKSGDDGYIPCALCRSVAYERWREGAYNVGALLYANELEGPSQNYTIGLKPQYAPQKPVSPERAKQWKDHIQAKTGYTFPEEVNQNEPGVYDEG